MPPGRSTRGARRAPVKPIQREARDAPFVATAPTPDAEIFRTIFQSAATGLVHTDLRGRVLQANPSYQRILGYNGEQLRTKTWQDLTHEDDRARSAELFERLIDGKVPSFEIEKRCVRRDGATVWVHDSVSLTRDPEGRPLYAHAVTQDITEKKRAEEAAAHQRALYEAIAAIHDQLGDGVGVADLQTGRFAMVNDSFCRTYGYTRDEVLRLADASVLAAPEERALMAERMRKRRDGQPASTRYEVMGMRKDGIRIPLEVSARSAPASNLLVLVVRDVSDRRRAERAKAHFSALVDSADLAIVGFGLDGAILAWNAAAQRIFGWTADEMVGQPFTSLSPHDTDQLRRAFQGALRGESLHYEAETFRKDGTRFPAAVTISPVREGGGVVMGVSCIVRDESSRRRSEEALHDALSLYSATLESTADGILVVDLQGTIRSFNRRFVDVWKVPAAILGDRDEARCSRHRADQTKDPPEHLASVQRIYANPEKDSFDVVELRDGRIIERLSQPQRIGDRVVGRVWTYRDVTDKVWGERALQLTRELALSLADAPGLTGALEAVLSRVASATGWALAQAWTPTATGEQLECSRASFAADKALIPFHEHSRGVRFRPGQGLPGRVWASRKPAWVEDVRRDPNFPRAPAATKVGVASGLAVPVLARDEVVAVLEFFLREPRPEDKRLTQFVSAVAAQLGTVVQRKRAEEALREKTEELSRINQELEQFVYFASHDLREPLHVVMGYLNRLEQRYRDGQAEFEPMWDYAVKGAVHMQDLIKDLLSYARLGRIPPDWQEVELNDAIKQVVANLKWDIEESHAQLTHEKLPKIQADPRQIAQVLQNLVSNAVKFRRTKGRPKIHIEAKREDEAWHLTVTDNGIGIPKADQDRIFVIFQRLHTQEEYPGTGIGLSICKKIIENHGGRIWVESTPGSGSTFHITVPQGRKAK